MFDQDIAEIKRKLAAMPTKSDMLIYGAILLAIAVLVIITK